MPDPVPALTRLSCLKCKRYLAHTDGERFIIRDHFYIASRVTLYCATCGARRNWRPGEPLDKTEGPGGCDPPGPTHEPG